jgi:hypothetical protein
MLKDGRHVGELEPDLYRGNFEVNNLKPFACLAFPHTTYLKTPRKQPIFGDELVTSFLFLRRKEAAHIGLAGQWAHLLSMSGLWANSRNLTSGRLSRSIQAFKLDRVRSRWRESQLDGVVR